MNTFSISIEYRLTHFCKERCAKKLKRKPTGSEAVHKVLVDFERRSEEEILQRALGQMLVGDAARH